MSQHRSPLDRWVRGSGVHSAAAACAAARFGVVGARLLIGACADSVFVRNCSDSTFHIGCKQLRTRDCVNCTFYLCSKTEPIIELSTKIRFGQFNVAYTELPSQLAAANIDPTMNLWFAIFDFNDEAKTGKNWSLLTDEEEGPMWEPLGACDPCLPRVPAGSIPIPSEAEAAGK